MTRGSEMLLDKFRKCTNELALQKIPINFADKKRKINAKSVLHKNLIYFHRKKIESHIVK